MPGYDPVGSMGGIFAPAYIAGDPTATAAVNAWDTTPKRYPAGANPPGTAQFLPGNLFAPPHVADDPVAEANVLNWMNNKHWLYPPTDSSQGPPPPSGPAPVSSGAAPMGSVASGAGYGWPPSGGAYSQGGPVAPGLAPPQVMLGVS